VLAWKLEDAGARTSPTVAEGFTGDAEGRHERRQPYEPQVGAAELALLLEEIRDGTYKRRGERRTKTGGSLEAP
jgi:hypothetical protein